MKYEIRVSVAWVSVLSLLLFVGLAIPAHAGQIVRQVSAMDGGSDDAEEVIALPFDDLLGRVDSASSDLELGQEGDDPFDSLQPQLVGVRFRDITIPAGATITGATIAFTVDKYNKGDTDLKLIITGELDPNPLTYVGTPGKQPPIGMANFNISSRPMTSNSAEWQVPSWFEQIGQSGSNQTTPDLTAIVQELVGQGGWAAGNAMAFMFEPSVLDGTAGIREAESVNGGGAPVLTIDYVPEPTSALLAVFGLVTCLGVGRSRRHA
ncbi:MAG: hypothetical protein ABGX16_01135 [Pirellulales bacterium]